MWFLGNALQKYAILAAHPALVPFVTTPFSPHDLMQTIQQLLPQSCQPNAPNNPATAAARNASVKSTINTVRIRVSVANSSP
jgi:hypothetical protein